MEIPRAQLTPVEPGSFKRGFDEQVGIMQVSRERAQRKKQERDIQTLSALLGKDLKTIEGLKVLSQIQMGTAKLNAQVKKAEDKIALDTLSAQYMTAIPDLTPEQFELMKLNPDYYRVLANSEDVQEAVKEKNKEIFFNTTGKDMTERINGVQTLAELRAISQEPGFNALVSDYLPVQMAFDDQIMRLSPSVVQEVYDDDGNLIGDRVISSGNSQTGPKSSFLPEPKPKIDERVKFELTPENRLLAETMVGAGGSYSIINEDGIDKIVIDKIGVPSPTAVPPDDYQFKTPEAAGEFLKGMQAKGIDGSVRLVPETGKYGLYNLRPRQLSTFEQLVGSGLISKNPSWYDPTTEMNRNGNGLTQSQARQLEPGTYFIDEKGIRRQVPLNANN